MFPTLNGTIRKILGSPDIAIDLGTANTRLYALGRGMIADEPSIIRVDSEQGQVRAIGKKATKLRATNSKLRPVLPLHSGVVTDITAAAQLIKPLLQRSVRLGLFKPRVLACAPTDASEKEQQALIEAMLQAGASKVAVVPEPLAAALGAGLDVSSDYAQMLVDIGDGVTDIAIIRSGALISTAATRIACSDMHHAVREAIFQQHKITPYLSESERLTKEIGALRQLKSPTFVALGRNQQGQEQKITINHQDIVTAVTPVIDNIVMAIKTAVRNLPPMTSCEVIENGICLTGGGAYLPGMIDLIAKQTCLEVKIATNPMHAVINGAKQMLAFKTSHDQWHS